MLRRLLPFGFATALVFGGTAVNARPPVVHNGTRQIAHRTALLMGNRNVERSRDTELAGRSEAFPLTAVRTGKATAVLLFLDSTSRASAVRAAIYTNARRGPGSLVTAGLKRRPVAGKWNTVGIRAARLHARRTYWLALLGSGGDLAYRDRIGGSCSSQESRQRRLHQFPTHWVSGPMWRTCPLSAFILGTVTGPTPGGPTRKQPTPPGTLPTPPTGTQPTPPPSGPPSRLQKNCITKPSACGYPDATNSGVPAGTQLTSKSGHITAGTAGQTISNLDLNGTINVTANNVTIKDSRITAGDGTLNGVSAITIQSGVSGTVVEDTTMQGSNCQRGSLFAGVMNNSNDLLTIERDYGQCLDDILHGSGTIKDSYAIDNANIPNDHYEPIAYDGGGGSITIDHNTLLNPHDQTAAVFVTCYFGPVTSETIDNNLMAGGGYVIYGPEGNGACSSATGHQEVKNNRFSPTYFQKGGYYGIDLYFQHNNTTWSGNVWDDTLAPVNF